MKLFNRVIFLLLLVMLSACGGGGGGSTSTPTSTSVLKLSTSGTPSAKLAGISVTITLPNGVTPTLNSDGSVAGSVVAVTGVAAPGAALPSIYTPATAGAKGTLKIVMASSITAGFGVGEFATVTLNNGAGIIPSQSDFMLSSFSPVDVNGAAATGLTVGFTM